MSNQELALVSASELVRQSTDIAGLCKDIVVKSAMEIQGRKYVKVEGWMSIATAHGCVAGIALVERVDGGYRAVAELRRMVDSVTLATAEGFVGEDEPTWYGGEVEVWDKQRGQRVRKALPKRPDYAIRAMAQTRAISRVCRSAFAHVVVLMDAGLSTTPAEEVPSNGFEESHREAPASEPATRQRVESTPEESGSVTAENWRSHVVKFGKRDGKLYGKTVGELPSHTLEWFEETVFPKWAGQGDGLRAGDRALWEALKLALEAKRGGKPTKAEPKAKAENTKAELKTLESLLEFGGYSYAQLFAVAVQSGLVEAGTNEANATKAQLTGIIAKFDDLAGMIATEGGAE